MVLLGIGEDGHAASLFPGHKHPEGKKVLPIFQAPKFPAQRVSMGAETLGQCRNLMFIITGKGKSPAVTLWQQGERLPVSMIKGAEKTEVIIDKAAFPEQ
jgi:6-phosphogluconolactonase